MDFPRDASELTAAWLAQALDCTVRDVEVESIGVGVGLLGLLYRLRLHGDGPPSVVAKFPIADPTTRDHVAAPLRAYQTEVGFYRDGAAEKPMGVPAVHAAEIDEDSGDFVLLLEDLGGLRCEDQLVGCPVEDARTVLSQLADHHAHHASIDAPPRHRWTARFDDPVRQQVIAGMAEQAVRPFLDGIGGSMDAPVRDFVEALPTTIPTYLSVKKESTETLAHCDLRLDNIFFGGADRPMVLLDWQLCGVGGVAYDVAYFLSQSLTIEARRSHEADLIDGYLESMAARGCPVDREGFMIDYRRTLAFCMIYPLNVAGQMDLANERAHTLVHDMLGRCLAAIDDHDALAVWPSG